MVLTSLFSSCWCLWMGLFVVMDRGVNHGKSDSWKVLKVAVVWLSDCVSLAGPLYCCCWDCWDGFILPVWAVGEQVALLLKSLEFLGTVRTLLFNLCWRFWLWEPLLCIAREVHAIGPAISLLTMPEVLPNDLKLASQKGHWVLVWALACLMSFIVWKGQDESISWTARAISTRLDTHSCWVARNTLTKNHNRVTSKPLCRALKVQHGNPLFLPLWTPN